VKKVILLVCTILAGYGLWAQNTGKKTNSREDRRAEKRQRINTMIRQEEEGTLNYTKQSAFGLQLRTNGYGVFYEHAKMKSPRFANLYAIELTEIKNNKEEKLNTGSFWGNSFIYGKINNFYQLKVGLGQQYIFGQKGNKNGIAVIGIYQAGVSLGLLRPYYIQVDEGGGQPRYIKYDGSDSTLFLDGSAIIGGGGLSKGWGELKYKPGAYAKVALRFDFGHYNETISAIEIGMSLDAYASKIPIMVYNPEKQLFFQGHIAFVFGHRK